MDTEDCKENIEARPLPVNSRGSIVACPASPAPPPLADPYLQQVRTHHQNTPPLHPRQLPPPHQHFSYPMMRMHSHDTDADDQSIPCADNEHCTYDDDILMQSDDTEHNTCAKDAFTRSTNTGHLHHANNVEAVLMKPYASYSEMHTSNNETAPGISAAGMGAPMHRQKTHGIISNQSNSDASPQPGGTPQMSFIGTDLSSPDNFKKKRAKARKCSVDGDFSAFSSGLSSSTLSAATKSGHHRARGQMSALDQGLRPHIIAIARGEDVSVRITSFQQEGNQGIYVLSAVGSISNVTLRHSETSGGTITYEGCYDILSLSGSLSPVGIEDPQNRGGLIVSLAGLDGRVIGGEVKGVFVASSPIQVVVGTFLSETHSSDMQRRQVETGAGSLSCASIPLQQTSTLDRRPGSGVCDSHQYQHMVTSHSLDM